MSWRLREPTCPGVVIGHCDAHCHDDEEKDLEYYLPILDRGAYVEFDLIGWVGEWPGCPTDDIRARRLASLVRLGAPGPVAGGHRYLPSFPPAGQWREGV